MLIKKIKLTADMEREFKELIKAGLKMIDKNLTSYNYEDKEEWTIVGQLKINEGFEEDDFHVLQLGLLTGNEAKTCTKIVNYAIDNEKKKKIE